MKIDKIKIDNDFCYPEFPIIDSGNLIICLRFSTQDAREDLCAYSEIRSINLLDKSTNWTYQFPEEHKVQTKPANTEKTIFICTQNHVIALNKNNGMVSWQHKVELYSPSISIIDNKLFLIEQNQLFLLDVETGKKIKSKKYRVQWLCGSVVEHNNRLFVSTSNSKIIEVDRNTLDIINEFKFTGKWAVDIPPLFLDNRMYANSYTSYAICFDLTTNEPVWKVKKTSGSEPKHLLSPDSDLYCVIEAFNPVKIIACSLENGKRKWTKDYQIHCLENLDKSNMIGLVRNEQGNYQVCTIRKDNGKIEKALSLTDYSFDNRFQYRLWEGAEIIVKGEIIVIAYSPNEIFIVER